MMTILKIITLLTALFAGVSPVMAQNRLQTGNERPVHHRMHILIRRGMMQSPTRIVATVRRFIRHFAGTFARGRAHVHHRSVA